jgi:hypothetical protein
MHTLDCLVIGAGPAGLTGGDLPSRATDAISSSSTAGRAAPELIPLTHNFPAWPQGVSGEKLLARLREQALRHERIAAARVEPAARRRGLRRDAGESKLARANVDPRHRHRRPPSRLAGLARGDARRPAALVPDLRRLRTARQASRWHRPARARATHNSWRTYSGKVALALPDQGGRGGGVRGTRGGRIELEPRPRAEVSRPRGRPHALKFARG